MTFLYGSATFPPCNPPPPFLAVVVPQLSIWKDCFLVLPKYPPLLRPKFALLFNEKYIQLRPRRRETFREIKGVVANWGSRALSIHHFSVPRPVSLGDNGRNHFLSACFNIQQQGSDYTRQKLSSGFLILCWKVWFVEDFTLCGTTPPDSF